MANRPVFSPKLGPGPCGVSVHHVEFEWFAGMSKNQKQKSVDSLHLATAEINISPVMEVSSKSRDDLGVSLSAFNLMITTKNGKSYSVETAFQSSKVFENGGPYTDLLEGSSLDAKRDIRLKESGNLTRFEFYGTEFDLIPRTFFYDWLYINALQQNLELAEQLTQFKGFTDIEFNPKKSINCQAYAAALYVSLNHSKLLEKALESPASFQSVLLDEYGQHDKRALVQSTLI